MAGDIIDSYLVSLGATVDQASFNKFHAAMLGAEKSVYSSVGSIAGNLLKFQVAGTTAFATVGFGIIGYIDKLAMADQKTKMLAMQNMMSTQQYRAVSSALDVLGVSLDDVFYGTKEVQDRFHTLIDDQKQLAKMVGPGYEKQMQQVRDVIFQLQRLELKGQYFGMKFASDLLTKLGFGDDGIVLQLEHLNDFIMERMPAWSNELSTDIIPVLRQFWGILRDTGSILAGLANAFTYAVGVIAGDTSLQTQTTNFHQFATAIGDVVRWLGEMIHVLLIAEKSAIGLGEAFVHGIKEHKLPDFTQHVGKDGKTTFDLWHDGKQDAFDDYFSKMQTGFGGIDYSKVATPQQTMSSLIGNGAKFDVDTLVKAVGYIESRNRQTDKNGNIITSAAGALGQMQLMPQTARGLGVNPFDATDNVRGGTMLLEQLLTKYKGNLDNALAAYNWGSRKVDNALEHHRAFPAEVRQYARDVEQKAGFSVGTIIVQSAPNFTQEQHAAAIKKGVKDGLDEHYLTLMTETNGAYQ
jgi:Transglycosylase SLT domain